MDMYGTSEGSEGSWYVAFSDVELLEVKYFESESHLRPSASFPLPVDPQLRINGAESALDALRDLKITDMEIIKSKRWMLLDMFTQQGEDLGVQENNSVLD